jgi:hypothetical protein
LSDDSGFHRRKIGYDANPMWKIQGEGADGLEFNTEIQVPEFTIVANFADSTFLPVGLLPNSSIRNPIQRDGNFDCIGRDHRD